MRALLIVAAVVGCAVAVALAVKAVLAGRIEDQAASALREDVARRTGREPEDVRVSLEGWLAAFRLQTGPATDATATIRGIAIPQSDGSLTRLRMTLDGRTAPFRTQFPARGSPRQSGLRFSQGQLAGPRIGEASVIDRVSS